MAVTKAQICNMALGHINQSGTTISNLDTDQGNTADQCRIHYDNARRFVLADHDWNFGGKRVALTDIGSPSALWTYRYDYPSDCLRIREIERLSKTDVAVPYEVSALGTGDKLVIQSDLASAICLYSWDVVLPTMFSPGFVTALSWYLASELAPALSGDRDIQQAALSVYDNYKRSAKAADSSEGLPDVEIDSPWEQART